tara:strand:+ start:34 stop:294 length:261 start_codon:yes stop_codon:yes gene_type:complete
MNLSAHKSYNSKKRLLLGVAILPVMFSLCFSCATGRGGDKRKIVGNEGGSSPMNDIEEKAYKKAILKCYNTGGRRIVKIKGVLRCY